METLTFIQCLESKKGINNKCNHFESVLNSFPKNQDGSIPDIYKKMNEYLEAKKQFNFWFNQLQEINKYIVKNHKKENKEFHLKNRFKK